MYAWVCSGDSADCAGGKLRGEPGPVGGNVEVQVSKYYELTEVTESQAELIALLDAMLGYK